ncbi:CARDB domain-containing protein [Dolichospermum compactum]|uniref:Uncharacterized protein n=1 Tax=Dolichospermum compactum NIES-806 TaxID=1973481 RepID=A0A1Z4V1J1_9CYAN|nr:CARDB domain-containing protein [Dolichospermum compactum]BAZ85347.1 hypothetical protein NIES806_15500 [Dolichospermum compactum NIES-806]
MINGDFVPTVGVEKAFYDGQKKQIRLLVNNTGEATTRAKTEWNLTQDGKTVNSGKVEETTIIAKGERYIEISYPPQGKTLTPGNYQLVIINCQENYLGMLKSPKIYPLISI